MRRATAGFKAPGKQNVAEGIWESHLSDIEHGRIEPSISTIEKISAGLNMPLWRVLLELFCDDNKERRAAIRDVKERTQERTQDAQKQLENQMQDQPQNGPQNQAENSYPLNT